MEKKISQPETFCSLQKAVPGRHSGSGTPMHDRQSDLLCALTPQGISRQGRAQTSFQQQAMARTTLLMQQCL